MTTKHPTTHPVRRLSGTRKREFYLSLCETPYSKDCNSYWDGGSRDNYTVLDMNGKYLETPPRGNGTFNKFADPYTIKPGTLLMETGIFCGKPATVTFYGNESDRPWITKLLGITL